MNIGAFHLTAVLNFQQDLGLLRSRNLFACIFSVIIYFYNVDIAKSNDSNKHLYCVFAQFFRLAV